MILLDLFSQKYVSIIASICILLYEKENHSRYLNKGCLIVGVHVGNWGRQSPQNKRHCALQTQGV